MALGFVAATSSIFTPPWLDAIITGPWVVIKLNFLIKIYICEYK